jgi:ribosome-associated protein
MDFDSDLLLSEVWFTYSRSSGKGGQNVNKVSSKAELHFNVKDSHALSEEQKQKILKRAASKINESGILRITSQEARTQRDNKDEAIKKFILLLKTALKKNKKRVPTKPSADSKELRLAEKKRNSEIKKLRQQKLH